MDSMIRLSGGGRMRGEIVIDALEIVGMYHTDEGTMIMLRNERGDTWRSILVTETLAEVVRKITRDIGKIPGTSSRPEREGVCQGGNPPRST